MRSNLKPKNPGTHIYLYFRNRVLCLEFWDQEFISIIEVKMRACEVKFRVYEVRIRAYEVKIPAYEVKISAYEVKICAYEVKISAYEVKFWPENPNMDLYLDF